MKNPQTTKESWDYGERRAIEYLQSKGYKILATNFKFWRFGEIDIIAQDGDEICAIEVKFRNNTRFGLPEESITLSKLRKCLKTFQFYAKKHAISEEYLRFDVLTFQKIETGYRVKHYKRIEL